MQGRSTEERGDRASAAKRGEAGWAHCARNLYSIYLRGLGGTLRFDDFIRQQLAIDLLTECVAADPERQSDLLADVLHLLTAEDFEADDDL